MENNKIALVCQSFSHSYKRPFGQGGTDSQIYGLSEAFVNEGFDVYILGNFIGPNWKDKDVDDKRINFVNLKSPYLKDKVIGESFSSILLSKKICAKIKDIDPSFVVLCGKDTGFFPSRLKIPKVYVTHNPDGMYFYKKFSRQNNILNSFYFYYKNNIEESVMKNCDLIIALNEYIKEYLNKRNFKRVEVVSNAVNPKLYENGGDRGYILYAGGLRRVKGIEFLIESFNRLKDNFDIDLVIIGSGPDEKKLKQMKSVLELSDRIKFIPTLPKAEFREYLSKCSVFVLPSLYETFGIVLIEAMASSKPVIASNIPGPQDVVDHGIDGYLFEKRNLEELTHYLNLLLGNKGLRTKLGKNARKKVENNYDFKITSTKYIELFNSLIRRI